MGGKLLRGADDRLERLCGGSSGGDGRARSARIRIGSGGEGIERLEAHFVGQAFAPHRHDTYAIGVTLAGVQTFRYRGEQRTSLPGQLHILHPDEVHDGGSGTDEGFAYRILYIDPRLIGQALCGRPLPFGRSPVVAAGGVGEADPPEAWGVGAEIDEGPRRDIVVSPANHLVVA